MKKPICVLLCVLLLSVGLLSLYADASAVTMTSAPELMEFVMVDKKYTTPIRIVPAVLTQNGQQRDVYLVALLGMKSVGGQVNSQRGGGTDAYLALVRQVLFDTVPQGAALVVAGHSLGGMTAQLLRADKELTKSYEILNVLCGGSPLMDVDDSAEGTLHRLTDVLDVIPYIRSLTLFAFFRQICTAHRENGGYYFNPDGAHNLSYARRDVWGAYDVFGVKGGDAALQFDPGAIRSFGDA